MTVAEHTYLSTREAADFLRCSMATLKRRRLEGLKPTWLKNGRLVLYRQSDLIEYLENK